jgi:hypothetical protein
LTLVDGNPIISCDESTLGSGNTKQRVEVTQTGAVSVDENRVFGKHTFGFAKVDISKSKTLFMLQLYIQFLTDTLCSAP